MEPKEQAKQIQDWYDMGKRIFIIDEDGNTYGTADYTRWNNAKRWQRILGSIFRRYKNRFIDVKGIDVTIK